MTQQTETIELIKTNLVQQANFARVTALTYLIDHEEQRIKDLQGWGQQSYKDENHYAKGINAAKSRIDNYREEIRKISES